MKRDLFSTYFESPYVDEFDPDLVLIDGRFRVASLLTALLRAKPGTAVEIDDYVERPNYHLVEDLLAPMKVGVRQAAFQVPKRVERLEAERLLKKFEYVVD